MKVFLILFNIQVLIVMGEEQNINLFQDNDLDGISDDLPDVTDVTSFHHQKSHHQSKITSSPKIITKVDFSLLLQKRSLDGGRPGCPEALSTTNPPGFEQYQKPCVEGGISDIQCVPCTGYPSARGAETSWKSQ